MNNSQPSKRSVLQFYKNVYLWQIFLLFSAIFIVWLVFSPGLFSNDSANQYGQALKGEFNNWHPPLMSIVTRLILQLGGEIGLIVFLQCVAAILGTSFLSRQISLKLFRQSPKKSTIIATIVPIILLIPITPYIFYTVTFWKDVWVTIFFLWIITYLLWLSDSENNIYTMAHLLFIIGISSLLPLVRHNAIVVLPAIGISLLIIFLKKISFSQLNAKKILAVPLLFAPLIMSLLVQYGTARIFHITNLHPEDGVKSLELSLLLKNNPKLVSEFPITAHHIETPNVIFTNTSGSSSALLWDDSTTEENCFKTKTTYDATTYAASYIPETTIDTIPPCFRLGLEENKSLGDEYWKALKIHPVQILKIKLNLFFISIRPKDSLGYVITKDVNDYPPLNTNERSIDLRHYLYNFFEGTKNNIYLLYGLNIHALWILVNIGLILTCVFSFLKNKEINALFNASILIIPLSYYLSYVLVSVATDYRFMYPSTLVMQIIMLSKLSGGFKYSKKESISN